MMKFPILLISTFLLLFSCSNLTKNFVRKGELSFSSGKVEDKEWSDRLKMRQYSWYKELNLIFDIIMMKITPESPFYNWFSAAEKESMSRCKDNFVIISYAQDNDKISKNDMLEQLKSLGYSRYALRDFKKNLQMHPDYEFLRLQLYKVDGICQDSYERRPIKLSFPGFTTQELSPPVN